MEAQKVERSNAARYGVRRVSWQGIASSILLIIQIILLFSAVYLSYLAEGKGGLIVGILGVAAFVLAIVSVGLSIWGLLKKDTAQRRTTASNTAYLPGAHKTAL